MLISTNFDDGSSVDSELNGTMPPPTVAPSENVNGPSLFLEEDVEETAAGWNEVTDNFETRSVEDEFCDHHHHHHHNINESSGVLIVPGEEADEEEEKEALLDERGISGPEIHLSFEGSIPSEIGSLGDDLDPHIAPESLEGTHEKPADSCHKEQQEVMSGGKLHRHFSSYLFMPTVMALVCMSAGSFFLYRERNALLASVSQLEQQILDLQGVLSKSQEEAERAAAAAAAAASLNWDSCQNSEGALVDNCWFKANVELGECAQDMKKAVVEHSLYFMDRLEEFGKTPFEYTEESSGSSSSFTESESPGGSNSQAVKLIDRFGKTLWSATVVKEDKPDDQEMPDATNGETNASYSTLLSTVDHFGHFGSSLWKHTVADVSKLSNGMKDATSSLLKYFHSNESSSSSSSKPSSSETNSTEGVEDLLQGFSELLTAVSSLGFAAGEALLASTVEMAAEVLETNYTLHDLKKAVEEASLTHGIVN